jgi:hypothetical protein
MFRAISLNNNTDCNKICQKVKELMEEYSKSGQLDPTDSIIYIEIKGVSHTIDPQKFEPQRLNN